MKHILLAALAVLVFAAPAFAGGDGLCDYSAKLKVTDKGKAKIKLQETVTKETKDKKIIASSTMK
ncbi:MAG: hypothetical protein HOC91_06125 [Nitrospinaceae bacterium]|mgnify:CR=1 FL=1|jgi:hypothetical protein|nr:hypothetical protein [Nitrospinaceae bacterium]MBT3434151.1 hypothetical protein [Nitrospinaceae bacterium]MBT3823333.1 hypothetical protein [Nitrospinaceae bacterium]MBT4095915.1 hypothetical protein [Nitrospinaceae bacterium]MBT4430075.1 hypothetical protein [Nitrospinaceae bacterium]